MNPSHPPSSSASGSISIKEPSANFSLPSRKRSFDGLHGLDSSRKTGSKSRRTSPSPSTGVPASPYAASYTDPVTRELELHKIRQREIEEAAAKLKKDREYARHLQDRYSAHKISPSENRPAASKRPSAYDRMMGTPHQPSPSRSQKYVTQNANSQDSKVPTLAQGSQPDQRPHGYQSMDLALKSPASLSTLGSDSLPKMPGSYPDQDSDSDIEIISSADFRENKRGHPLSRPSPATNVGYGSYLPHAPQGPSSEWPPSTLPYLGGYLSNNSYYPNTYGQPIGGAYPGMTSPAMNAPLAQILNQTSAVDFAAMRDRLNQGLAGEIYNYVTDPRKTEKEIQDLLENIRPDTEIPVEDREGTPEGLKYPLYEHQKLALTWLKSMEEGSNKGGILADDMGLGKTISTLALLLSRPSHNKARKVCFLFL